MGEWQPIPLGSQSYRPRSGTTSIERLINLYAEPSDPNGKSRFTLYGLPGLALWSTVGDGPNRGLLVDDNGDMWIVSGNELYWVSSTKAATLVGVIAGSGRVRMVSNGTHVLIATSNELYYADKTSIFVHALSGFNGLVYQDGYGILTQAFTQNVYITGLDDFTTIDALDFTTADAYPDKWRGCISDHREVYVGKGKTIEIFYNSGNSAFPFDRIPSGFIERGLASPGAIAKADSYVYWLGDDLRVYRAGGYTPEPISTPGIDRLILDAYSPSTSEMFIYEQLGHHILVLGFADLTLIYDIDTGKWGERRSFGLDRWRASGHAVLGGTTLLVGDYDSGKIYELDMDTYSEDSAIIERIVVCPPLSADPRPIFVHEIYLDLEAGVGLTSGQGSDPTVMLSWSDDDGRTWSSDVEASLGALGNCRWRASFSRLGRSRNRSFRFRITDPVKVALLGAHARFDVGVS